MTLGDIISQYRREHAISMDKFSKMSGISKAYISMLEKNRTQRGEEPAPSIEMYRNVADAIGVDVDELVRMVDGKVLLSQKLPSNCLPLPRTVKKPRLGAIACGKPILAVENISEYDDVPITIHCDFTLLCKGDSMIDARIWDGDVVYIRQQPEVENGEIAAVRIGEEATLKKVYYNGRRIILRACNPLYADMEYEGEDLNDVEILGKAVAFSSMI
nr:MAG TPA: LexA repressor [Caudoviricetes sp.]